MKILFISRAYPPVWGGIERQNFGIAKALSKKTETCIIANKKGKKNLPLFLPWVALKTLFIMRNFDVVLFGDGVLAPIGAVLKIIYKKKKFCSIVHGLDITFARKKTLLGKLYRLINIPSLRKLDKLIMVGNETIAQAETFKILREKCVFIPNGLDINFIVSKDTRAELEKLLGFDIAEKKIIFRGGRFTRHKGVEWFIRSVMPVLPESYILVAAGGAIANATAGDENNYANCLKAVSDMGLEDRVKLIVNIKQKDMNTIYNTCDVYISPNIKVSGTMEGFGITAIEAAACGRVVLASNLEGLKDAIKNGENGFLIEPENVDAWAKEIKKVLENNEYRRDFGEKARKFIEKNYTWENISRRYLEEIEKVIASK
jgi:glycosyltransferase involved in cell wall biosynthesis